MTDKVEFQFRPAVRQRVRLLLSLAGGTGAGKTKSGMLLAKGLSNGKKFAVIDSENGRASMYAPPEPSQSAKYPGTFDFDVIEIRAPYTSERYQAAIEAAESAGYEVIFVDQMSHEYEGDGGILDRQEIELSRMVRESRDRNDSRKDWQLEDAHNMRAWNEAKAPHKKLVSKITQLRAHLIVGLRADDKIEIKKEGGKTIIQPKQTLTGLDGWVPICEKKFPFEVTASFLMVSTKPGVPRSIKKGPWLQEVQDAAFPEGKPITEESGRILGEWAAGGALKIDIPKPETKPALQETRHGVYEPNADAQIAALCKRIDAAATLEELKNLRDSIDIQMTPEQKTLVVDIIASRKKTLTRAQKAAVPESAGDQSKETVI